jgi:chemotaxis methyl-accepting protein methylase
MRVSSQNRFDTFKGNADIAIIMKKLKKPASSANQTIQSSSKGPPLQQEHPPFPIVGIGASAGGLDALELFLGHVPEKCGMAFVIIQHLDPTHKGIMPELLRRTTTMDVFQVTDRMQVNPDCVYVIPPNSDMSILHGVLHLFEPTAPHGLRLPIDSFLHSLAEDRQERSIGVILSGMGSDGTIGLRAIKEKGGLTLVQEPASAKFNSMPKSAIEAGVTDLVAPVEQLPGKIIDSLGHVRIARPEIPVEDKNRSGLEKILILLRTKTGQDFSQYKQNTVYRRIERRMGIHQLNSIAFYVRYLQENPQELELLFKELLIGVTSFFRDQEPWEQLREKIIATLLVSYPDGGTLRAWSTGCSTGEEAYSLAMTFKEALDQVKATEPIKLQIFATDLAQDAIDKARLGKYPFSIENDVSSERLRRFFVKEEDGYRVGKEIREMVTFATQNLIMAPPFTRLDILICRNLLIYLAPELQKKLLFLFYYSLKPGGVLFLGNSESTSTFSDLFIQLHNKSRLFRRHEAMLPTELLTFPATFAPPAPESQKESLMVKPAANLQLLADQLLLQCFSPPAVLVNNKGDILYISGRTGKYLEPAAGKANWNIFAMAREGLRLELGNAFQKALRQNEAVVARDVKVGTNGGTQIVNLTVQLIQEPEPLQGMVMIIFTDVAARPGKSTSGRSRSATTGNATALELEQLHQQALEELQTTREEMQSSQEDLKSTNEELQSTNEELQSTNEELTTSKEEMQSMNEELQTVNAEQESKMDELSRLNDDMRNLLDSTEIVTVFLDNNLHIRRFTTGADKLFKLLPGDVGRPLSDITSDLFYPEMVEEARDVMKTLAFSEKQITATNGRWFSVRIMPYRTMANAIAGVVITFANITAAKQLEAELCRENAQLKALLEGGGV